MLTMQVTMIPDAQLLVMSLCLGPEQLVYQKTTNGVFINDRSRVPGSGYGNSRNHLVCTIIKGVASTNRYGVPLYCDNLSAMQLAENPIFHARTKHVEAHYHFIREKILKEEIKLKHVRTGKQVADLFIKGLDGNKFEIFRQQLGIVNEAEAGVEREY
ncbi:UNVERIFIED_CONTAM: Retrovirus-related Pol polyprotein from transposon TNT 1-94 [Sesamum calycinum]|uniref:Retrovirus-related Pol polyprotein from transposon TNT 1-94 n=1 Tax=Sesamum calycinum TaxID=2727403 RepID=A0AAW2P8W7_9LAMI